VGVLQFLGGVGYNVGMEDNIMALTITVQSTEPIPTGEYTVELSAIELVDTQYGKQLRWTFVVPDHKRTLVAYSSLSSSPKSKCIRWASALLNRAIAVGEQVDLQSLVGKTATASVVRKRKEDGTEYNSIDDLLPPRSAVPDDPFA
jgi:hypothetical protein